MILSDFLKGAIVGAVGPILVTWIKEHYQSKRENQKLIYELGKIYWQEALIAARNSKTISEVYPLESFIISIKYLFEEITSGKLNEKNIKDVLKRHSNLMKIIKEHYDKNPK